MPHDDAQGTAIEEVARRVARAKCVAVVTGAGVSAESGVATFRDAGPEQGDALWSRYDPMQLATIDAFNADPELVTRWYHWRFSRCAHVKPNPGHVALAELQRVVESRGGEFVLLTQNIDGLHQAGGSTGVVELHGTILTWRCVKTGEHVSIHDIPFDVFPPRSRAGGLLRPNVVWFGEVLPEDAVERAQDAASRCDVFLTIGTSGVVYPAASFVQFAGDRGAFTAEVNKDPTPLSHMVDVSIMGRSGEVMPRVVERVRGIGGLDAGHT